LKNLTASDDGSAKASRDAALMRSLVSAHILLGVVDGQFVSLLEPPEDLKGVAASCQNVGAWPVLVGAEGDRDTMLASPIILYDYPQIAPESPGDLFDGTEIDEILALRILTMTDDEKSEMRNTDERARKMLERTENLPMEHLMKLHGTLRELRSLKEDMP
jgi:hydrogenase maturation protease